jgi:hypothetical protein
MDTAISLGFKKQELRDVNLVRIFLGVTTISDITSAMGDTLLLSIWKGQRLSDRASRFSFPRQEPPASYQQGLWRRLLKCFLVLPATSMSLRL